MQMEYSGFPREDSQHALIITRTFAAPRARVWQAWTDPALAHAWMGARGFTATHLEGDLQPHKHWRLCLRRDTTGEELWQGGVYLDIAAPERMVYTFAWDNHDGRRGHETQISLTLGERAGKTTLYFRQETFQSVAERDGHRDGWNSCFDRLEDYLAALG